MVILNVVKYLIKHGADVNKAGYSNGAAPLFIAAQNGHLNVVKYLIKHGADIIEATTDDDANPLSIAARLKPFECE